jgi:hypothetical protein
MTLSETERARIREEEIIRLEARHEMKRKQAPRLILVAILWSAALAALSLLAPLLHRL